MIGTKSVRHLLPLRYYSFRPEGLGPRNERPMRGGGRLLALAGGATAVLVVLALVGVIPGLRNRQPHSSLGHAAASSDLLRAGGPRHAAGPPERPVVATVGCPVCPALPPGEKRLFEPMKVSPAQQEKVRDAAQSYGETIIPFGPDGGCCLVGYSFDGSHASACALAEPFATPTGILISPSTQACRRACRPSSKASTRWAGRPPTRGRRPTGSCCSCGGHRRSETSSATSASSRSRASSSSGAPGRSRCGTTAGARR